MWARAVGIFSLLKACNLWLQSIATYLKWDSGSGRGGSIFMTYQKLLLTSPFLIIDFSMRSIPSSLISLQVPK